MRLEIPETVSFGLNIKIPAELVTRPAGELLEGIRDGTWREPVLRMRSLSHNGAEQRRAKTKLPFATWSGIFSHKSIGGLQRHSGLIGIDLDGLSAADCTKVVQDAVADPFCLAAYRSARGGGVRLLFRISPCDASQHDAAFGQVAEHVRNTYGHEADSSARDVSRASFVSFDEGLWCYPNARVLPVVLDLSHSDSTQQNTQHRCVTSTGNTRGMETTTWIRMGKLHVGNMVKPDGTVYTHVKLLHLSKAMALHARRINHTLTNRDFEEAIRAWFATHDRKGLRLRGDLAEYRAELRQSAEGAFRKRWFTNCADKWIRWTRHPDYPVRPSDRLLFAIRKHCAEMGTPDFYIGARDAGLVLGKTYRTAARHLAKLVTTGELKLLTVPGESLPTHAYEYRLVESPSGSDRSTVAIVSRLESINSATGGGPLECNLRTRYGEHVVTGSNQSGLNLVVDIPLSARLGALRR
jgi:hypothetical protein